MKPIFFQLDALDDENAIQLLMSYKNLAQELEDDA